jgi:integrase
LLPMCFPSGPGDPVRLTKQRIGQITLPAGKTDHIVFDRDLPGFGLRLRAGGGRTWILQYRTGHRQRRETLGDVRKLDADMARKEAKRRLAKVELGHDPQAERIEAKARAKFTLASVAKSYLGARKEALRASSYAATARYLERHWSPLHGMPVDKIERRHVASRLTEISTEYGSTAAARARAALSALFSWAMREGITAANPVIGSNMPALPRSRERVLDDSELAAVWRGCREDDFGRIVRLLVLAGARRDEIAGLRWDEIDFGAGMLRIGGGRTKNHREHVLPLPPMAVAILQSVSRRDREHVFGEGAAGFVGYGKAKAALDRRAGLLAPWRLHDLRRSFASGLARLSVELPTIEQCLNHRSGSFAGIVSVYQKHDFIPEKRRALALWADHVRTLVKGGAPKIVQLGARR